MSVAFTVKDHVARVTIDRPDRMNAVDLATEAELVRIWVLIRFTLSNLRTTIS